MSRKRNSQYSNPLGKWGSLYVESLGKWGVKRLTLGDDADSNGEFAELRGKMQQALATKGKVLVYRRKKEVWAVAVFTLEKRSLPISLAVVERKELFRNFLKFSTKNREVPMDDSERVVYAEKNCFVCKGVWISPNRQEYREALEQLLCCQIEGYLGEGAADAYIGPQGELVLENQVTFGGKYIAVGSLMIAVGMSAGALFGALIDPNQILMWMALGLAIGCGSAATTTIVSKCVLVNRQH